MGGTAMKSFVQNPWPALAATPHKPATPGNGSSRTRAFLAGVVLLTGPCLPYGAAAQTIDPTVVDPNLAVRTVVAGLNQPTSMAFLPSKDTQITDILVLEKTTGKVQRVLNGAIQGTVLDLAVNSAVERGLLGIALHPGFPHNPGVYLYWTETNSGADSTDLADVPLLGNRVDRFVWDGHALRFERNLIKLHAFQADEGQTLRGNHNGGVLRFG